MYSSLWSLLYDSQSNETELFRPVSSTSKASVRDRFGTFQTFSQEEFSEVRELGKVQKITHLGNAAPQLQGIRYFASTEFSETQRLTILRSAPIDRTIVNRFRPNWVQLGPAMISVVDPCSP